MTLRIVLTDGSGVQALTATFGAFIASNIIQTAADAANAAASAAAALASQNAAATSASSASGSASSASTSATNAANSASSASTSATNAANSASAASTSASSASGSATAASTSATNAANSATAAAGSASAAATSASNAATTLANALTKANNLSDVANAVTALANLSGAKRGANSDITSLTGLTTALSVGQGGTGQTTLTAHAVLLGEGTSGLAAAAIGTAGRVLVDNGAGVDPSFQSLGVLSGKNRFINGSMAVDQRNGGNAQTIVAGAALAYTVDRFYAYCTGANVTGQQGVRSYAFSGAASVTGIGYGQRIESKNISDLAGKTATLSVFLADSLLTTVNWTAYYANTVDSFGTLASPTRTQIATGSFTVNSSLSRYSTQIALPANAANGVEVVCSVGAQTSGTFTVGDVQLEEGSVATSVDRRQYGHDFALCRRYYQNVQFSGASLNAVCTGATDLYVFGVPIYEPLRTTPTGAIYGTWSGNTPASSAWTSFSITPVTPCIAYLHASIASGGVAGQAGYMGATTGSGYILSAEL